MTETLSQGDCFFDSVKKALPLSMKKYKDVLSLRKLLIPHVTKELFELQLTILNEAKLTVEHLIILMKLLMLILLQKRSRAY